jgi:hypothetical protein
VPSGPQELNALLHRTMSLQHPRRDCAAMRLMMTPKGFIADEGVARMLVVMRRVARLAYLKKMMWLMPRMRSAVPYLGYLVVAGQKSS